MPIRISQQLEQQIVSAYVGGTKLAYLACSKIDCSTTSYTGNDGG